MPRIEVPSALYDYIPILDAAWELIVKSSRAMYKKNGGVLSCGNISNVFRAHIGTAGRNCAGVTFWMALRHNATDYGALRQILFAEFNATIGPAGVASPVDAPDADAELPDDES